MHMQPNFISTSVFLFGVLPAIFAVYAWQHRATRGSQLFSIFMASMTVYVLGYSMELASLDLHTMLFWSKIEYLGIFSFPTLFLLFVLQYTGKDKWLTWKAILLLFFFPGLLLIAKLFDDSLHLVYRSVWVDTSSTIPLLGFTRGPIYPLALYAVIPVSLGVIILWQQRQTMLSVYQRQAAIIVASVVPPILIFIFYMSGFQPFPDLKHLDLNAFMTPLWGIGIGWAAFRYGLFDFAPVAREVLIENLNDGVFVLDDRTRLVDANLAALKIMGWTQPPIGQDANRVFAIWKDQWNINQTVRTVDTVKIEIHHVMWGENVFFDMNISSFEDSNRRRIGHLIVIHDITARKQLEARLLELSLEDELTGLSNRRGFYLLAAQIIQMVKRMNLKAAVIFMDLDNLKMINDSFGHAEGDRALMDAANLLRMNCRASDILARYGGDEFVALVIETEENGVNAMVARFNAQLEEFNAHEDRKFPILLSYGITECSLAQSSSLDEMIAMADKAMYEQKQFKKLMRSEA